MTFIFGVALVYGLITYAILRSPEACSDYGESYSSGSGAQHN
jgi:hypothetical protein